SVSLSRPIGGAGGIPPSVSITLRAEAMAAAVAHRCHACSTADSVGKLSLRFMCPRRFGDRCGSRNNAAAVRACREGWRLLDHVLIFLVGRDDRRNHVAVRIIFAGAVIFRLALFDPNSGTAL